jgi:hypothetical protein
MAGSVKRRSASRTDTARNAKSQAATKIRDNSQRSRGSRWAVGTTDGREQAPIGAARRIHGCLYGNFPVSKPASRCRRRFRCCPNLPRFQCQDLITSLHRGLAEGGGVCARVGAMWGRPDGARACSDGSAQRFSDGCSGASQRLIDCFAAGRRQWQIARPTPSRTSPIGAHRPSRFGAWGGRLAG